MIEMTVEFVRVSIQNYNKVVILKEKEADRYLLIWIGQSEAEAIAMRLSDVTPPRPQTHDLLRNREPEEALAGAAAGHGHGEPTSRVGPEELEKMSAFKDFIESLDMDD